MSKAQRLALIVAGGTGGHIFPALAVAENLRDSGWQVDWLGTREGRLESRVVPAAGFTAAWVWSHRLLQSVSTHPGRRRRMRSRCSRE